MPFPEKLLSLCSRVSSLSRAVHEKRRDDVIPEAAPRDELHGIHLLLFEADEIGSGCEGDNHDEAASATSAHAAA